MNENDIKEAVESEKIACEVCLNDIPVTEAKSEEATDYVVHFCGLDCYDKWKRLEASDNN